MPLLDDDRVHILIILLLIPLQFLLWNYINSSRPDMDVPGKNSMYYVKRFLQNLFNIIGNGFERLYRSFLKSLYSFDPKKMITPSFLVRSPGPSSGPAPPPPKIIELHERNHVFFGANQRIRKVRPTGAKFSIGQVVRHRLGYKAVVIGWDEVSCAPEFWMVLHNPRLEREIEVRGQPNYRVLADAKDTLNEMGPLYVPQDELEALPGPEVAALSAQLQSHESVVRHSLITEFFDFFDGTRFSPRPWLRRIYPLG